MSITGENQAKEADNTRRTVFAIAGLVALLAVAGLVIYLLTRPAQPQTAAGPADQRLEGGLRAGSPEFEKRREFIKLDEEDAWESNSMAGGKQMDLVATVRNFTGRTLSGLEIKGSLVDLEDKLIKERTVVVIPSGEFAELENNKTARVKVTLTGFDKPEDRAKIEAGSAKTKIEVTAFSLK